jgi:potassium-dependent mechanosensitive channel
MTAATNMLFALVIGGLLFHLLLSRRYSGGTHETSLLAGWLRVCGWLILAVIVITLVSGYPAFAAFLASRLISVLAVLGALYLSLAVGKALFAERIADNPYNQELAANFGVSSRPPAFAAILACGGICLALMLAALVLYIGPW